MLMLSFFSWWYGQGWRQVLASFGPRLKSIANNFSVFQLLRTLFQPWRRIVTYPGASLDAKLRALVDNLISRAIGFTVRFGVLLAALITTIAVIILTIIELIIWPLLPLGIPFCLIAGVL